MRTPIVLFAVLLHSSGLAKPTTLPAFPDVKIGTPSLSLIENAREGMPPVFGDPQAYSHSQAKRATAAAPKYVSRMPVVAPEGNLDLRMLVKTPDESMDYKMLVKKLDSGPVE